MVFRRDCEKTSDKHSGSDTSSDSAEEDLEYLIDDLLEKLSVCPSRPQRMTIKNKNRKERQKHDRSERPSNSEVAGTSRDEARSYTYQRFPYTSSDDHGQPVARNRGRSSRSHAPSSTVARQSDQFPYQPYVATESAHTQPSLKRSWPRTHDSSKKTCDRRDQDEDSDTGAGNNSEDEYYSIPEKNAPNSSKVSHIRHILMLLSLKIMVSSSS